MTEQNAVPGRQLGARPRWSWLLLVVLLPAAALLIHGLTGHHQVRVPMSAFPVVNGAAVGSNFIACAPADSAAYNPHNPCQTFLLLQGEKFGSSAELLAVEARLLTREGWHHAPGVVVDGDSPNLQMATRAETWRSRRAAACAYVTTVRRGVAAETKSIFPKDPHDIPQGVYDFLADAVRAQQLPAIWVRLQPLGLLKC